MSQLPVVCDFCHTLRNEKHDLLACYRAACQVADMNNLRKLERIISRLTD